VKTHTVLNDTPEYRIEREWIGGMPVGRAVEAKDEIGLHEAGLSKVPGRRCGPSSLNLRRFAALDHVRKDLKGYGLRFADCQFFSIGVSHYTRKLCNRCLETGHPPRVRFRLEVARSEPCATILIPGIGAILPIWSRLARRLRYCSPMARRSCRPRKQSPRIPCHRSRKSKAWHSPPPAAQSPRAICR
jgi:hypothetical protein